ncbi:MAG: hypothetical protein CFH18_00756 [Alphaproteobacteria bacterium MarineAlpha5_Bin8]|nr:MAG: hypothetical protein CFH17_00681 [Alphaproteobacteria bacterium MarineAlpha5_Bin7]PPR45824.1 MAG: hypothetical protein CFH18_00756 [Alphaproteobacteria bacterium MarineAlpha5_Bin8]PPR54599.1 MAG: hypothetical protein CFH16_00295 [Alphaproteobacteria bacterium MarineAlpha5_Bin6]|tara:strand:+ start:3170 stop:3496 length:327 start_codon:yes stop_codon:yes gene_type:complete
MNTFDERKKGFEAKYLQDQEAQFKVRAIRNKLVGQWAATLIKPNNENEYISEVRLADLEKPGDDDIIDKLFEDFNLKNLNIDKNEIKNKIEECEIKAIEEFQKRNKQD